MDFRAVNVSDIEIAVAASSEDEAFLPVVTHFIEEAEAFDKVWSLIELLSASCKEVGLVDLPVVSS